MTTLLRITAVAFIFALLSSAPPGPGGWLLFAILTLAVITTFWLEFEAVVDDDDP